MTSKITMHTPNRELQARISAEKLAAKVGKRLRALVDGRDDEGRTLARSSADAPEIDGVVYVNDSKAAPGDFIDVRIVRADTHDLYAELDR